MAASRLDREEYVEQAYFFRVYRERIENAMAAQEVLTQLKEELLATTKLPTVVDFLAGEIQLHGRIGEGMQRLSHYFTPFQTFVVQRSEEDDTKFDTLVALRILEHEAEFKAESQSQAALFVYEFECLARNRLGYDAGLKAISQDAAFDEDWQEWIRGLRRQVGTADFADLIYQRSEQIVFDTRRQLQDDDWQPAKCTLFGMQEGRIAKAHRHKDPLYMFSALQRHLGYPRVPQSVSAKKKHPFDPVVEQRFLRVEARLNLIDAELKGGIDLSEFYKPEQFNKE